MCPLAPTWNRHCIELPPNISVIPPSLGLDVPEVLCSRHLVVAALLYTSGLR